MAIPLVLICAHVAYILLSGVAADVYRGHAIAISLFGAVIAIFGTMAAVFVAFSENTRPGLNSFGAAARNIGGSFALYGLWLAAFAAVS